MKGIIIIEGLVHDDDNNNNNNNNNDNNNNSNNSNLYPKTRKYWVDVQRWIVSFHGGGVLFSLGWQSF